MIRWLKKLFRMTTFRVVVNTTNKECYLTKEFKRESYAYMEKFKLESVRKRGLAINMAGYTTRHGQPCSPVYKSNGFRAIRVEEVV